MLIAVVVRRFEPDGLGLPASTFSASLDWPYVNLPAVGDLLDRPGVTWRVTGRRWSQDRILTLSVDEWKP